MQQNDEVITALQGMTPYEIQETLALLGILALGEQQIAEGKVTPVEEVFEQVRKRFREKHAR